MKEKPILFTTDNTRKVLEDRKTMTRRIIKPQPIKLIMAEGEWWDDIDNASDGWVNSRKIKCPYEIGMHLWVRETFRIENYRKNEFDYLRIKYFYKADFQEFNSYKWTPSIFMPREASRITLEVTNVGVERIQDISENDCISEGIEAGADNIGYGDSHYGNFEILWDSIYAKPKPKFKNKIITHYESYPWSFETSDKRTEINGKPHYCYPNAWVWVDSFKRIK